MPEKIVPIDEECLERQHVDAQAAEILLIEHFWGNLNANQNR